MVDTCMYEGASLDHARSGCGVRLGRGEPGEVPEARRVRWRDRGALRAAPSLRRIRSTRAEEAPHGHRQERSKGRHVFWSSRSASGTANVLSGPSAPATCTGRRSSTMKRKMPIFDSDEEAERFVETATCPTSISRSSSPSGSSSRGRTRASTCACRNRCSRRSRRAPKPAASPTSASSARRWNRPWRGNDAARPQESTLHQANARTHDLTSQPRGPTHVGNTAAPDEH